MADEKSTTAPAAASAPAKEQGAGQPAKTGEATTTTPTEQAQDHVPLSGSPGGVYRMVNDKRVRAQD